MLDLRLTLCAICLPKVNGKFTFIFCQPRKRFHGSVQGIGFLL